MSEKINAGRAKEKFRNGFMRDMMDFVEDTGDEVLQVGTNQFCIPAVTEDGEEIFVKVTFQVPTGQRGGDGYDGYEEARLFALDQEAKALKAQEKAAAKERKIQRDKKRREEAQEKEE